MKRLLYILIALTSSIACHAITQHGTVRSITRPNKASKNLPSAVVRIRGSHNAVETDNNGAFSLLLQNKQNGDAIAFSSVTLSGWEIAESSFMGKQIACSELVPIEILMVNRADMQREKEAIADKARRNVEIYYEQRLAHLDSLLADGKLMQDEYQNRLDELEQKYEQFEPLLQTMAEQYARTDIAKLDSLSIKINSAIESGNPDEAERLIKLKGDIDQREQQIHNDEQQIQKAQELLNRAAENTNKQKRELGDDFFRLYSICLTRLQFDSAGYYLMRRAQLDTTDVDWQLQAGRHALTVLRDITTASELIGRGYRLAKTRYGQESALFATASNEYAKLLYTQGNHTQAKELYQESLNIRKKIRGENSAAVAEIYNNLGVIAQIEKDLTAALKYHKQALEIRTKQLGDSSYETAESLSNIGGVYYQQEKYKQAINYFNQAAGIFDQQPDTPTDKKANVYNNLAATHFKLGDTQKASEWFKKAYQIYKQEFGEQHPLTKNAFNNLNYCLQNTKK